jgi:pimeloyl-ACP methyl ester carboxylesterase
MVGALIRAAFGGKVRTGYTLSDMAGDAIGLLDALGIQAAHVMGSSMGGMIAQLLAIEHPQRVLSLVCVSSTSGDPKIPQAPREALARLSFPPPMNRPGYVTHTVELQRFLNGPVLPFDEERARRRSEHAFDRGVDIMGAARHFLAQLAAPSRKEALARVTVPTLVVHGDVDPVSRMENARSIAEAVPGAELLIAAGMGHDLSPPVWGQVIDAIARNARRAEKHGAPASAR